MKTGLASKSRGDTPTFAHSFKNIPMNFLPVLPRFGEGAKHCSLLETQMISPVPLFGPSTTASVTTGYPGAGHLSGHSFEQIYSSALSHQPTLGQTHPDCHNKPIKQRITNVWGSHTAIPVVHHRRINQHRFGIYKNHPGNNLTFIDPSHRNNGSSFGFQRRAIY